MFDGIFRYFSVELRPDFSGRFTFFTGCFMKTEMVEKTTENVQMEGAGMRSNTKRPFRSRFAAKRLAFMAVFVALSYAVSFLEIPLPLFGARFLRLDFGNVFIILISFLLGPLEGILVCFLKESLRCLSSTSMCAGELANFVITSSYLLLPSILYQYRRNLKTVICSLGVACLIATAVALVSNRFLIFPTFAFLYGGSIYGMSAVEAFEAFWVAVLIFNLIKTILIGAMTLLLYKRLSNFLKKMKI